MDCFDPRGWPKKSHTSVNGLFKGVNRLFVGMALTLDRTRTHYRT